MSFISYLIRAICIIIVIAIGYVFVNYVSKKLELTKSDDVGMNDILNIDASLKFNSKDEEESIDEDSDSENVNDEEDVTGNSGSIHMVKRVVANIINIVLKILVIVTVFGFIYMSIRLFIFLGAPSAGSQTGISLFK